MTDTTIKAAQPSKLGLPQICRLFGVPHHRVYGLVLRGVVPVEVVAGKYQVEAQHVPALAEHLGLPAPASTSAA